MSLRICLNGWNNPVRLGVTMLMHSASRRFALADSLFLAAGCSTSAQQPRKQGHADVVATVGGVSITLEQLDQKALQEPAASFGLLKLSQAVYEARSAMVVYMIGDVLIDQEAKRRNVDRAELYEKEITKKAPPVVESDI